MSNTTNISLPNSFGRQLNLLRENYQRFNFKNYNPMRSSTHTHNHPVLSKEFSVNAEGDLISTMKHHRTGAITKRKVEGFTSFYSYAKAQTYLYEFRAHPTFIKAVGRKLEQ